MATAGQPTPVGPAKASPAADELTRQLDELEKRVKALAESGECYADVEAQIAAARAHLAAAEMKDAQEAFDRAADAKPSRAICIDPRTNRTYHYWHIFVPGV